jgi:SAM-dependent methyltransferase
VTAGSRFWDSMAAEYDDAIAHPRTAALRAASVSAISAWAGRVNRSFSRALDVGCGTRSVFADAAVAQRVTALDVSFNMLRRVASDPRLCATANALPVRTRSVDVVVASLGAPFNVEAFWRESARVIRHDGVVIYTGPGFEWSLRERSPSSAHEAQTVVAGKTRTFETIVLPPLAQTALIELAGLDVIERFHGHRHGACDAEVDLYVCRLSS